MRRAIELVPLTPVSKPAKSVTNQIVSTFKTCDASSKLLREPKIIRVEKSQVFTTSQGNTPIARSRNHAVVPEVFQADARVIEALDNFYSIIFRVIIYNNGFPVRIGLS